MSQRSHVNHIVTQSQLSARHRLRASENRDSGVPNGGRRDDRPNEALFVKCISVQTNTTDVLRTSKSTCMQILALDRVVVAELFENDD